MEIEKEVKQFDIKGLKMTSFFIGLSLIIGLPLYFMVNKIISGMVFSTEDLKTKYQILVATVYLFMVAIGIIFMTISFSGKKYAKGAVFSFLVYVMSYLLYYLNWFNEANRYETYIIYFYVFAALSFCCFFYCLSRMLFNFIKRSIKTFIDSGIDEKDKLTLTIMFFGTIISLIALFK